MEGIFTASTGICRNGEIGDCESMKGWNFLSGTLGLTAENAEAIPLLGSLGLSKFLHGTLVLGELRYSLHKLPCMQVFSA